MAKLPWASRWQPGVRVRILGAVLALTALGMTVAGFVAYEIQRQRTHAVVAETLGRAVEEFTVLATDGVDPETGEAFDSASRVLYVALQRIIPSPNEGMLGFVDGQIRWTAPGSVALRLEGDPELLAAIEGTTTTGGTLGVLRVETAVTTYDVAVAPISSEQDAGVFVAAFDIEAELEPLQAAYGTYALVAFVALALVGAVGWVVAGRLLSPLTLLGRTARRINETDLSERIEVTGTDDISDLAVTVNAMLDRLERAFSSQRELLDDVSHELRTPLTVLRGHLELVDPADPADVEAAKALTLDEVDRMGRLIDDLTTLAHVDHPDFAVPARVDVGLLTDEVFDKARGLGPQPWAVEARADATGWVDAQRLTQAWLQLAANAAKFSPDDAPIRLGSRAGPDGIELWVRDEGPGIDPADLDRVLRRFERGEGARGTEGSGLGLTIVDAIAGAHDGTVAIDSAPGAGTTVRIVLPVAATAGETVEVAG